MSRSTGSTFQTEMRSVDPKPVVLFEIATGITATPYIRVAISDSDVSFGGNTYTARPAEHEDFEITPGESGGMDVTFADADGYFANFRATADFRWKTFTRYVLERDAGPDYAMTDSFRISQTQLGTHTVIFTVKPLLAVLNDVKIPAEAMTREEFPGITNDGMVR